MKYIRPRSLTWWASLLPLLAGAGIITEPLHGWHELAQVIRGFTGDTPPMMLVNAGLAGIGLRAAMS